MTPFAAIFVPDDVGAALSDRAWLTALLAVSLMVPTAGVTAFTTLVIDTQ